MTKDQLTVFVPFGTGQTQKWLFVRMPNPDMPIAPVQTNAAAPRAR